MSERILRTLLLVFVGACALYVMGRYAWSIWTTGSIDLVYQTEGWESYVFAIGIVPAFVLSCMGGFVIMWFICMCVQWVFTGKFDMT